MEQVCKHKLASLRVTDFEMAVMKNSDFLSEGIIRVKPSNDKSLDYIDLGASVFWFLHPDNLLRIRVGASSKKKLKGYDDQEIINLIRKQIKKYCSALLGAL